MVLVNDSLKIGLAYLSANSIVTDVLDVSYMYVCMFNPCKSMTLNYFHKNLNTYYFLNMLILNIFSDMILKLAWILLWVAKMVDAQSQIDISNIRINKYGLINDSKNFWIDIAELCNLNKYISVIECDDDALENFNNDDYAVYDFAATLIEYLRTVTSLPVMIFTSTMMRSALCEGCDLKNQKIIREKVMENHLMFVVYETLTTLNASTYDADWVIYSKSKKSYFILTIMQKYLEDVSCVSSDFEQSFKHISGQYFNRFWNLRLVEVTMIFPVLCEQEYILKYDILETFRDKDYSKGVTILDQKHFKDNPEVLLHNYNNFKQYPLKINAFPRIPTLVKSVPGSMNKTHLIHDVEEVGSVGGLDGFGMGNLVKRLNFSSIIKPPSDGYEYGYKVNGSFTGSIGDIISQRNDISFNARFIKLYGSDAIDFTVPVFYDQFCVLVPKSQMIPTWMSIFLVFSVPVWSIVGVTFLLTGFVWWLMKTKFPENPNTKLSQTNQCFLFLDICLVLTSWPWTVLPKIDRERFLLTVCLIFNLIFAGLFQVT